ncbi:MAG: phenylalanine--tRNA ligase subunit beta [Candidatus Thermoplasmatota archaeon]
MTVVTFSYKEFLDILGYDIPKKELIARLPMIGADCSFIDEDTINMEIFPNRPDMSSIEGIARATRAFFGFETGLRVYPTKKSDIKITVDPSVKSIRPFVSTSLVKDIDMSDEMISSLMDLQEKLHLGLGRNRRKVAIGVHDFSPLKSPFIYKAVDPDSVEFVPLGMDHPLTLSDILKYHEKGIEYSFILEGCDKYPIIVDSDGNVLSFPPIINGVLTEVTSKTRDVFIDVTGTDLKTVRYALNIIITALSERGGIIYSTIVNDGKEGFISPVLSPAKKTLSIENVNRILGVSLNEKTIIDSLLKMGYNAVKIKDDMIQVEVPPWRCDILHEIDLIEDVAIGYGYDKFPLSLSERLTFGKPLKNQELYDVLRCVLIGLGFNEVTTFTISNKNREFTKLGFKEGECVEIENPIGEEYSCLRTSLLPSLLDILSENKHHPLPQRIFELGDIVREGGKNRKYLSGVVIDAKDANFTYSKSIIEAIMHELPGEYSIAEGVHPAFIPGRCACIIKNRHEAGVFGEIHPRTITDFKLEYPIVGFEIMLDKVIC